MLSLIITIAMLFFAFLVWIIVINTSKSKQTALPLLLIHEGIELLGSGIIGCFEFDFFLNIDTNIDTKFGAAFGYIKSPDTNYLLLGLIYTTNVIKGYHRQLRKVTKTKAAYHTDEALIKIIYLATVEASKKWTMPVREWNSCLSQFTIYFEDRLESEVAI